MRKRWTPAGSVSSGYAMPLMTGVSAKNSGTHDTWAAGATFGKPSTCAS